MNLLLSCSFLLTKCMNERSLAFGTVSRIRTCIRRLASEKVSPYCCQMVSADLPSISPLLAVLIALYNFMVMLATLF